MYRWVPHWDNRALKNGWDRFSVSPESHVYLNRRTNETRFPFLPNQTFIINIEQTKPCPPFHIIIVTKIWALNICRKVPLLFMIRTIDGNEKFSWWKVKISDNEQEENMRIFRKLRPPRELFLKNGPFWILIIKIWVYLSLRNSFMSMNIH